MLVNKTNTENEHVKFVSYTGKWPNLCRGILTLDIDGKEYRFGHDYSKFESWKTDGNYDSILISGGRCGFGDNYSESYVESGEWEIDTYELPEELRKYATEIDEVINDNIPHGCCGGCL